MKLWKLEDPKATYDETCGLVVRAETEQRARELADEDEGKRDSPFRQNWLNTGHCICVEIPVDGKEEIILTDFWSA